ncbi:TraI/MobA(P) family conjugative relaxase [Morganella morganii]|uniref:TraI/MobA(P) family conjugative relaxase n=1 Tax=Morganella morganii TaxID=582 RepID=UPI0006857B12|nr:TraI/MobA(P) family conjugative relaxase [Morganella morganii]
MIIIIPQKRQDGDTSFRKLVEYISVRDGVNNDPDRVIQTEAHSDNTDPASAAFNRLVDYIDRADSHSKITVTAAFQDGRSRARSGIVESETNCFSLETAASEMNAVASQSIRCQQPVYHFILSWQESEKPTPDDIFASARYCLDALGMSDHQYVTSIHTDTDNLHCHIAVNRVNPKTYLAKSIWNDADILQKCCRELERKYQFKPDNGSWIWGNDNTLVRAPFHFKPAPQGAAKREIFSDKESLYHYAVRHVRDNLTDAFRQPSCCWDMIHRILNEQGLSLREHNQGLVICDAASPDIISVKASDVHPTLTKFQLERYLGEYQEAPQFNNLNDPDPENWYMSDIKNTYNPEFQRRDSEIRTAQRIARAEARAALKIRYQTYKSGWQKPDLQIRERYRRIAAHCSARKSAIRRSRHDPLLRKLLYRVAEFEKMQAVSKLRLTLKAERENLIVAGRYKPLSYRQWCEQEAINGDKAALSQLRGWAYREKRNVKQAQLNRNSIFVSCDDSPGESAVVTTGTHTGVLQKDGSVLYYRDGQPTVKDTAKGIELMPGFEHSGKEENYRLVKTIISRSEVKEVTVSGESATVREIESVISGSRYSGQKPAHLSNVTARATSVTVMPECKDGHNSKTASDMHLQRKPNS